MVPGRYWKYRARSLCNGCDCLTTVLYNWNEYRIIMHVIWNCKIKQSKKTLHFLLLGLCSGVTFSVRTFMNTIFKFSFLWNHLPLVPLHCLSLLSFSNSSYLIDFTYLFLFVYFPAACWSVSSIKTDVYICLFLFL